MYYLSRIIFCLLISAGFTQALAQDWNREKQDPSASELWTPVPPKVTPGTGMTAPSDATILFDGKDLSAWRSFRGGAAAWIVEDGAITVKPGTGPIISKQSFGSCQLHLEWRSPTEIVGEGQGRGNSGIFLMNQYEVQVLDSYESRTYSNGQASSVYKQHIPLVNATRPPGEWQSYDIIFMAPVFSENGRVLRPATVTVLHNGVLVQNHVTLAGPTQYKGLATYEPHEGKLPLSIQDHGNPVSFRNIWIREL